MTTEKVRVLLVEDHTLVRQGTKTLIETDPAIQVVGEADTAEAALRLVDELAPDVVLLDIRLKSGTGIDVARALQRKRSASRVLVVTAYDYEQYVLALTKAGVSGYILKDIPPEELIKAIHQVHKGGGVLPGKIAATVLENMAKGSAKVDRPPEELSIREVEVLELLMHGLSSPAIGQRLGLSARTIEAHVANILSKLGVSTREEAVLTAIRRGYLNPL